MSKKEKIMRLNCYMDFARAATWYCRNPKGKTHLAFFRHGAKTVKSLGLRQLTGKCGILYHRLSHTKRLDINLADDILTLGLLARLS